MIGTKRSKKTEDDFQSNLKRKCPKNFETSKQPFYEIFSNQSHPPSIFSETSSISSCTSNDGNLESYNYDQSFKVTMPCPIACNRDYPPYSSSSSGNYLQFRPIVRLQEPPPPVQSVIDNMTKNQMQDIIEILAQNGRQLYQPTMPIKIEEPEFDEVLEQPSTAQEVTQETKEVALSKQEVSDQTHDEAVVSEEAPALEMMSEQNQDQDQSKTEAQPQEVSELDDYVEKAQILQLNTNESFNKLIENIEEGFTEEQQKAREQIFQLLNNNSVRDDEIFMIGNLRKKGASAKSRRGSHFRGVSANGKKWQVQSQIEGTNHHLGTFEEEIYAGLLYDLHKIQIKGLNALCNFDYTKEMLTQILQIPNALVTKVKHEYIKQILDRMNLKNKEQK